MPAIANTNANPDANYTSQILHQLNHTNIHSGDNLSYYFT